MTSNIKEGDAVKIADRETNAEDVKSGLFYEHFRGLHGTVQKIYPTSEIAIEVVKENLAEAIEKRHTEMQEQMKIKWLDGLSEEAKNRLTPEEKNFKLRYTVLVHQNDVTTN